ncbi:unnamed protein product, partial [Iphiclides podalirius]
MRETCRHDPKARREDISLSLSLSPCLYLCPAIAEADEDLSLSFSLCLARERRLNVTRGLKILQPGARVGGVRLPPYPFLSFSLSLSLSHARHPSPRRLRQQIRMKKEAAIMAKEIEKRQKEYIEKQKMKLKTDSDRTTPLKSNGQFPPLEPVYMSDGFQYLNSDSEEEESALPVPAWSTFKGRRLALTAQARCGSALVDRLFSVRAHCPDLREIFPGIERARLKRTSSAVWRTPPRPDASFRYKP